MNVAAPPALLERITVRPLGPDRAIVSARLPHVNLATIWARRDAAGRVTLAPPKARGRDGRAYPTFALQPDFAAQLAEAAAAVWARADGR